MRSDPAEWHSVEHARYGDCLQLLAKPHLGIPLFHGGDIPPPLTVGALTTLHADLRRLLTALVTGPAGQPVMFPSGGYRLGLVRMTAVGTLPAGWGSTHSVRSARVAILHAVRDLVLQAGERLRACPRCKRPYVKHRKQVFCDRDCAQAARNEKKARLKKGSRG